MIKKNAENLADQHGFTLLELLIVITIVGILAGVAILSFSSVDHRRLGAEADRLKLAFNQAADLSLIQQETIAWFYDKQLNHYDFKLLDSDNQWEKLEQSIFSTHSIQGVTTLILKDSDNNRAPFDKNNNTDESRQTPIIIFHNNGEYTPFKLAVGDQVGTSITLSGDGFGVIIFLNNKP